MRKINLPYYAATDALAHDAAQPPPHSRLEIGIGLVLEIGFLCLAAGILLLPGKSIGQAATGTLAINFVSLILEAMPFMLLGALAGGIIEEFVPREMLTRWLAGRHFSAILLAAGMGVVLPVCECAIIPVVRRLLRKGIPFPAAIAYLLGGPIVNLIVASSTAVAYRFNWAMVAGRVGCGYLIAVGVALLMGLFFKENQGLRPGYDRVTIPSACGCGDDCGCEHHATLGAKLQHAVHHACNDFFEVGRYLIIGGFIAALMRTMVSLQTFQDLSSAPWIAIILMMALAILLNLCSEADAFIAASFNTILPGSAQLAFLVLGPMLDIKLLLMYLTIFRKRTIIALSLATTGSVLLTALFIQYVMGGIG